jgi:trehalose 6-phosphate phosphatase
MHNTIQSYNAIFLDVDGTLLDIAPKPDLVVVPEGLIASLERLQARTGGALALISGRPLDQIDKFFPLKLPVAAEHGAILRDADGKLHQLAARPTKFDEWYVTLKRETKDLPGVMIEVKTMSLVVHYRQAPQWQDQLHELAARLVAQAGTEAMLLTAHMALELRPLGFGKGEALEWFMQTAPFAGKAPIFVGDDTTDEPAIALATQMGGTGLHVARDFGGSAEAVRRWVGQ